MVESSQSGAQQRERLHEDSDGAAQKQLSQTQKLADMKSEDFDTIFYVGGHGVMWDLAQSAGASSRGQGCSKPRP
jgi:putative intracellular protease/amidase